MIGYILLLLLGCCYGVYIAASTNDSTYLTNESCCQTLQTALPGQVHFAYDKSYIESSTSYWSAQEQSLRPSCVLLPISTGDVSTALKHLSTSGNCRFAVKSGGYMAHSGAANIQDGVTIDLKGLNQIAVSRSRIAVTIGAGLRWGHVYTKLATYGLAVAGARSGYVGVGGYLLGGGTNYFIGHGFGCDNVAAYEIVLADGTILNVSLSSHSDLFKALRGGSSNFGIVTAFTMRTLQQAALWQGYIIYPAEETLDEVLKTFSHFTGNVDYDIDAAVQTSMGFTPRFGKHLVTQQFYRLPEFNPRTLLPFTLIRPQIRSRQIVDTLPRFSITDGAGLPAGSRQMTWALCIENDLQTLHALYKIFNASITPIEGVPGIICSINMSPLPQKLLQASANQGGNMLNLSPNPHKNGLILLDATFTWSSALDETLVRRTGLKLLGEMTRTAKQRRTYNAWVDVNHANGGQDPMQSYGAANRAFLQAVSRRYDPARVFQTKMTGGFKVF